MDRLSIYAKISIGLLAFLVGVLITSFIASIPTLEQEILLPISRLQWFEIAAFSSALVCFFPALYWTPKWGPRIAAIIAGSAFLLGSVVLIMMPNQTGIILSRLIDGIGGAFSLAIFYIYSEQEKLSLAPYAFILALGIILGPFIAHYHQYYDFGMTSTLVVFFILPALVIAYAWLMEDTRYPYFEERKTVQLTLLLFASMLPIFMILYYTNPNSLDLQFNIILFLASFLLLLVFFYFLTRSKEKRAITKGMPKPINLLLSANIIVITVIMIFWITMLPVYLIQVANQAIENTFYMMGVFNLAMIAGAYTFYLLNKLKFSPHRLIHAYLVIALGLGVVLNFWGQFGYWQILIGTLIVGAGIGMVFLTCIELMHSYHISEGQILFICVFYVCCGVVIGYVPLASVFYALEQINNAQLLAQYKILLPLSLATPAFENYLVMSNNASLSAYFTPEQIVQLKGILKVSFISAIHTMMVILFIAATLVLMFSNYILHMKEEE